MRKEEINKTLENWAKQLDKPVSELQKDFQEALDTIDELDEERKLRKALNKFSNELDRKEKRLATFEEMKGVIWGTSFPWVAKRRPNYNLYAKNILGHLESNGKVFRAILFGKPATELTIPTLASISFKGRITDEYDEEQIIRISGESPINVLNADLISLKKLADEFGKPRITTLKDLEGFYSTHSVERTIPVLVEGVVKTKFRQAEKKGEGNRRRLILENSIAQDFFERNSTVCRIPEALASEVEQDDEIIVLGDLWKPDPLVDEETGEPIEGSDSVVINAWTFERI